MQFVQYTNIDKQFESLCVAITCYFFFVSTNGVNDKFSYVG